MTRTVDVSEADRETEGDTRGRGRGRSRRRGRLCRGDVAAEDLFEEIDVDLAEPLMETRGRALR